MKRKILMLALAVFALGSAGAQKVAIKNNIVYDAFLTPNLGIEFGLGKRTSLEISGNYNPFEFGNNRMWKHWLVQPEFRIWTCDRFNGSFFGIHALGGEYNMSNIRMPFGAFPDLRDNRYEGWYAGGGISVGYQWILSNRWGLEITAGIGYVRAYYEKYEWGPCRPVLETGHKDYFGPTKLGVTFLFFL